MGRIGVPELIIIALVVILLFGAKKLPELANAIGKAIREFKKASHDINNDVIESKKEKDHDSKTS